MAMTLVSTVTVGSGGAASLEFTNIPQTGKDLLLVFSIRQDLSGSGFTDFSVHINGETTGTNYLYRTLLGNGSLVNRYVGPEARFTMEVNDTASTSNTFTNSSVYFSNYTSSTAKSVSIDSVAENNATTGRQEITAGLWNNTAAISSILLRRTGSNTAQYSTASLYIIS